MIQIPAGVDALPSPSLLVFEPIVRENLAAAIKLVGDPDRLRPHVKTHKMAAVVALQESLGLRKHKCATLAEAEMIARAGGRDILLAYPLVGPNPGRFARLVAAHPETAFRAIVDDADAARALSLAVDRPVEVLVDLDLGMGRTGIAPGDAAAALYRLVDSLPNLIADGLHAYDGHHREADPARRRSLALSGLGPTLRLRDRLIAEGFSVPRLILGGTPTFPIHAACHVPGVECSPGTSTLHDAGYAGAFPDLPFSPAAALLTRVISRPGAGRIVLDLGHKAVAADPVGPRLALLGVPGATIAGQSEEHLVVDVPDPGLYPPGTPLLAIPTHICPTVALHAFAYVIRDGAVVDEWEVSARGRRMRLEEPA